MLEVTTTRVTESDSFTLLMMWSQTISMYSALP